MTIVDFLADLCIDIEALSRFRRNPEETMAGAGLSELDQQAIKKGTVERRFPHHHWPFDIEIWTYEIWDMTSRGRQSGAPSGPAGNLLDKDGLTFVGLGIRGLQITPEARVCIAQASKVLYLVTDPVSEAFVRRLNPTAETLDSFYKKGKPRIEIYNEIVDKILSCLEASGDLCVVAYGHPGVLCYPTREAIRRAREKGVPGRMLAGISAEDNLIADLEIETAGLQSYEATAFLIYGYRFDVSAGLVLWQVGVLGETRWDPPHRALPGRLQVLADYLAGFYGRDHQVFLYRATVLPSGQPEIERVALGHLPEAKLIEGATLYVPPKGPPKPDPDMAKKLGL